MSTTRLSQCHYGRPQEVKIVNGTAVEYSDMVVHRFSLGDVEDPELYAELHIQKWAQSAAGHWVLAHAEETPRWQYHYNPSTWDYKFAVVARLSKPNQTFFKLKFQ